MEIFIRCLILIVLIVAAIASYSVGFTQGIFAFIVLGCVLELAFWFGVFGKKAKLG